MVLNENLRAKTEQNIAELGEVLPRMWRQLFLGCCNVGFTPQEAMDILKTYILAQNPSGIKPPDGMAQEPKKEEE